MRPRLAQLHQSGATSGQVPVWDNVTGLWEPGTVSGAAGSLDWLIVTDYGATGDGITDDTAAIQAALDAVPAAGGTVYFPPGIYQTTGGLTVTKPTRLLGMFAGDSDPGGTPSTMVRCSSTTAHLFAVSAHGTQFHGLVLRNNAAGSVTAGSGIRVTAGDHAHYSNLFIDNFWINLDVEDGTSWTMTDSTLHSPWKYATRIRHTDLPDGGDQSIMGCILATTRACDAAIRYESGGGLKVTNSKINSGASKFVTGIDMTWASASAVFLVSNCSIENVSGDGIRIVTTTGGEFGGIVLSGLQFGLYDNTTGAAIRCTQTAGSLHHILIDGINARQGGGAGSSAVVVLDSVDNVTLGPVERDGFSANLSQTSCTNVVDFNATSSPSLALDDLTDVDTTGQADGDYLSRVAGVWVPVDAPTATGGELLMQDGVSSPPVPLETEDGTDWLYEG